MSNRYPWYDSWFLAEYVRAKEVIRRARPEKLSEFRETLDLLRTRPDFTIRQFPEVFDDGVLDDLAAVVAESKASQPSSEEFGEFGRHIIRNHPLLTQLQQSIVDLVSDAAGEPVEPRYNFLSLYTEMGVCPVHMDAPDAKWTLDLCIRQSEPWPIHLSQMVPWPEHCDCGPDWQRSIKEDPDNQFQSYSLEPGNAILFSGSSQWHYRDPHPGGHGHFCDLAFFHFIPEGMGEVVNPANWARLFDIPELAEHHASRPVASARARARRLATRWWRRFLKT